MKQIKIKSDKTYGDSAIKVDKDNVDLGNDAKIFIQIYLILIGNREKIQKEIRCLIQNGVTLGNSHKVQSEFKYELHILRIIDYSDEINREFVPLMFKIVGIDNSKIEAEGRFTL